MFQVIWTGNVIFQKVPLDVIWTLDVGPVWSGAALTDGSWNTICLLCYSCLIAPLTLIKRALFQASACRHRRNKQRFYGFIHRIYSDPQSCWRQPSFRRRRLRPQTQQTAGREREMARSDKETCSLLAQFSLSPPSRVESSPWTAGSDRVCSVSVCSDSLLSADNAGSKAHMKEAHLKVWATIRLEPRNCSKWVTEFPEISDG